MDVLAYSVNREVLSFDNDQAAWGHINQPESADIIIANAGTSAVDGFGLLKKVKQHYPRKTCIVMSDTIAHENQARDFGADAFLAKPFGLQDLFELVQRFVVEADWKPIPPTS